MAKGPEPWPDVNDLAPLLSLPQVDRFFGYSPGWCHRRIDREAMVIRLPGAREVPVFRQGREFRVWRKDLRDAISRPSARRQTDESPRPQTPS